jgi:SulP family sulfate permease
VTLRQYVPSLEWLPKHQRRWLLPDAIAAVVVWAVLIPQEIAYAALVGLGRRMR